MLAKERQNEILKIVKNNGAVTTFHLTALFAVSSETIRRDLLIMEKEGLLTRVHGGAVLANEMHPYPAFEKRHTEYVAEKTEIAKIAASYISEGDYIAIDTGSTSVYLANEIKNRFNKLTVITNSVNVFSILKEQNEIEMILIGGHHLKSENAFYGPLTVETLKSLHVNKTFILPATISLGKGLYLFEPELLQVQQAMMDIADRVFVLADNSKFEKIGLYKVVDHRINQTYISDSKLSEEIKTFYLEEGINIITEPR